MENIRLNKQVLSKLHQKNDSDLIPFANVLKYVFFLN